MEGGGGGVDTHLSRAFLNKGRRLVLFTFPLRYNSHKTHISKGRVQLLPTYNIFPLLWPSLYRTVEHLYQPN